MFKSMMKIGTIFGAVVAALSFSASAQHIEVNFEDSIDRHLKAINRIEAENANAWCRQNTRLENCKRGKISALLEAMGGEFDTKAFVAMMVKHSYKKRFNKELPYNLRINIESLGAGAHSVTTLNQKEVIQLSVDVFDGNKYLGTLETSANGKQIFSKEYKKYGLDLGYRIGEFRDNTVIPVLSAGAFKIARDIAAIS